MTRLHLKWAALAVASAAVLSLDNAAAADGRLVKGEALLTKNCARCHAIGVTGESQLAEAPPLRQIVTRYPLDNLEEALAEGIVSGHADMPEFVFEPGDIDAILAYLADIKSKTNGGVAPKP
jgi:mono/diheme cytochrome c family protein